MINLINGCVLPLKSSVDIPSNIRQGAFRPEFIKFEDINNMPKLYGYKNIRALYRTKKGIEVPVKIYDSHYDGNTGTLSVLINDKSVLESPESLKLLILYDCVIKNIDDLFIESTGKLQSEVRFMLMDKYRNTVGNIPKYLWEIEASKISIPDVVYIEPREYSVNIGEYRISKFQFECASTKENSGIRYLLGFKNHDSVLEIIDEDIEFRKEDSDGDIMEFTVYYKYRMKYYCFDTENLISVDKIYVTVPFKTIKQSKKGDVTKLNIILQPYNSCYSKLSFMQIYAIFLKAV